MLILVFSCLLGSLFGQVRDGKADITAGEVTSLAGYWKFEYGSQHTLMQIPAGWIARGVWHDGAAVYRADFRALDIREDLIVAMPRSLGAYEVYWNNVLIGTAGRIGPGGELAAADSRLRVFTIPRAEIRPENEMKLVVRGEGALGGLLGTSFIGPRTPAERRLDWRTLWGAVLVGAFFSAALIHLVYFVFGRRDVHYLFFAFLSVLMGATALMRGSWTHLVNPSPLLTLGCIIVSMHALPPALGAFLGHFFNYGKRTVITALFIINAIAVLAFFAVTAGLIRADVYSRDILPWVLLLPVAGFGYGGFLILRAWRERRFGARMMLAGFVVFAVLSLLEVAANRGLVPGLSLGVEGYLALMLAMAIAISVQFQQAHRALEKAHVKLARSEDRYRSLVEGSRQLIVSLDSSFLVLDANQSVRVWLGQSPEQIRGRHFVELVYSRGDDPARLMVLEKLERALLFGEHSRFAASLRTSLDEPREMEIETESVATGEGSILLVKAGARESSELSKFCEEERQRYSIGNFIVLAELVSVRLTEKIESLLASDELFSFRMALRELLINAIEHGNLEITFAEKTRAQADGTYYSMVQERQRSPDFAARRVHIEYFFSGGVFEAVIRDEGRGFDHRAALARKPETLFEEGLSHGRGILIAKSEFDEMSYNDAGNEVTVRRKFPVQPA